MKFERLTKEQFENLHLEFSQFLASNGIDSTKWDEIKTSHPDELEKLLDIFSDVVWDKVLQKTQYLEQFSPKKVILIKKTSTHLEAIIVETNNNEVDLSQSPGWDWLNSNWQHPSVSIIQGKKNLSEDPQKDLFHWIRRGASISDGKTFEALNALVSKSNKK